jgi:hypothetical protein
MLFFEMIDCSGDPVVSFAGFCLIRKHFPEKEFSAAIHSIMNSDLHGSVTMEPALESLRTIKDENVFARDFPYAITGGKSKVVNACFVVSAVPAAMLSNWYHELKSGSLLPTFESIVVEELFSHAANTQSEPTQKMRDALSRFATIPGRPRLIYVEFADKNEAGYANRLVQVLEDPDTDGLSIYLVGSWHRDYIRQHLKIDELHMAEEKRERLNKALKQKK